MPRHFHFPIQLGFLGLFLIAGATSLRADTYSVVSPPQIIDFQPGEQFVSARAEVVDSFQAHHTFIQLALLGPPISPPPFASTGKAIRNILPMFEDCPTWFVSSPIPAVTTRDIDEARRILNGLGFANSDITTGLVDLPAASCGSLTSSAGARVGQILLTIRPNAGAQIKGSVKAINAAIGRIPNLQPGALIQARDTCDAEQIVRRRADREARDRADMLARIASLELVQRRTTQVLFGKSFEVNRMQTLCGPDAKPVLSPKLGYVQDLWPPYSVSVDQAETFTARPGGQPHPPFSPNFAESTTEPGYSQGTISYAFRIPANEPFVSAQGVFRALVVPDVLVGIFSVPVPLQGTDSRDVLIRVRRALHDAAIPDAFVRLHSGRSAYLTVRLRSDDPARIAAVQENLRIPAVHYWSYAFVRDCNAIAKAAAEQAYRNAYKRAGIMAAAARLGIGPVIAVDDAGQTNDAICGYGANSTTDALERAISRHTVLHFSGQYAEFGSEVAVAWQLKGTSAITLSASAPPFAPQYAPVNVNQAFITSGDAIPGFGSVPSQTTRAYVTVSTGVADAKRLVRLHPAALRNLKNDVTRLRSYGQGVENLVLRDDRCGDEELQALKESVGNALTAAAHKPVYALVDQGSLFRPSSDLCQLTTQLGPYIGGSYTTYDSVQYSIEHRVLLITGRPVGS